MAFGMFRMMFNAGGNAVPVIEQMNAASQKLVATSSGLSSSLNNVGTSMGGLTRASESLSRFRAAEQSIQAVNAQATHLQPVLLQVAQSMRQLGREVTGVTDAKLKAAQQGDFENKQLAAGEKGRFRAAQAYKVIAESIRTVGATGQITSTRLASLSQSLQLFAGNIGVGGQAQIKGFADQLRTSSAQMKIAEVNANAMRNGHVNLSSAQRVAHAETVKISDALARFSIVGGASSSVILRLANQLNTLSSSVHPKFSGNLKSASTELIGLGNQLRMTEQAAVKAGSPQGGFQMMTDVSSKTATQMRMMSSASQGAMIAMSLLQRNVTGLAFSLIFLQFSGFLKISLAIAGALAAVGALGLGFMALVKHGTKMKNLRELFFVLTGNAKTMDLAMSGARKMSERWGVSISEGLALQIENLKNKTEFTNEEFDQLGGLMALADKNALKNVKSSKELAEKFLALKEEGKGMDHLFKDLNLTQKEFKDLIDNLNLTDMQQLTLELAKVQAQNNETWEDPSNNVALWWHRVKMATLTGLAGLGQVWNGEVVPGLRKMDEGFTGLMIQFGIAIATPAIFVTKALIGLGTSIWDWWYDIAGHIVEHEIQWHKAKEVLITIANTVKNKFSEVKKSLFNWFADIDRGFTSFLIDVKDNFKKPFISALQEISDFFAFDLRQEITEAMKRIWKNIKDWGHDIKTELELISGDWLLAGMSFVNKLWSGIMTQKEKFMRDLKSFGSDMKNSLDSGLDDWMPNSPSRIGIKVGEGFISGLNKGFEGLGKVSSSPTVKSNVNININVRGAFSNDPRSASHSVATEVLRGITRQGTISGSPLIA